MILDVTACRLYEPDGTLLAAGSCQLTTGADHTDVRAVLDEPGRVLQRCLLGPVKQVRVRLATGRQLTTQVARVYFDARQGRTCLLRVVDQPSQVQR
jgi:hypothetical protein